MAQRQKYINLPDLLSYLEEKKIQVNELTNTSLTVPADIRPVKDDKKEKKKNRRVKLTENEIDDALDKLVTTWPQCEKRWADPPISGQTLCSHSFVPSKGATPNKEGLYGYLKCRGTFANEDDQDAHAEFIIENVDSYHAIFHGYVGQPIPLVDDSNEDYTLETQQIDIHQKKMSKELAADMKEKRENEKRQIEETKQRAEKIREKEKAAAKGEVDHEERYTTLRVKRANIIFSMYQLLTTLKRYKDTLHETVGIIEEMDRKFPQYQQTFLTQYEKASSEVGIPKEQNHILRYLNGPVPFDLSIIPDTIEVIPQEQVLLPFDPELTDPGVIAKEMYQKETGNLDDENDAEEEKKFS